jgi:hypothetical protein
MWDLNVGVRGTEDQMFEVASGVERWCVCGGGCKTWWVEDIGLNRTLPESEEGREEVKRSHTEAKVWGSIKKRKDFYWSYRVNYCDLALNKACKKLIKWLTTDGP